MSEVPILFFYALGVLFFLLGIETKKIILLGVSFFTNLAGYYLSYSDTNYLQAAYFPLVLVAITIVIMVAIAISKMKETFAHSQNYSGE